MLLYKYQKNKKKLRDTSMDGIPQMYYLKKFTG